MALPILWNCARRHDRPPPELAVPFGRPARESKNQRSPATHFSFASWPGQSRPCRKIREDSYCTEIILKSEAFRGLCVRTRPKRYRMDAHGLRIVRQREFISLDLPGKSAIDGGADVESTPREPLFGLTLLIRAGHLRILKLQITDPGPKDTILKPHSRGEFGCITTVRRLWNGNTRKTAGAV